MTTFETQRPIPDLEDVRLTRREVVVLVELAEDITLEEIPARLWVTRNTVKTQVRTAYRKFGVSTRAEAVAGVTAAGLR